MTAWIMRPPIEERRALVARIAGREDDEIVRAVVRRLQRRAAARRARRRRREHDALRRFAEVHRQRAAQHDEHLLLLGVHVPTPAAPGS